MMTASGKLAMLHCLQARKDADMRNIERRAVNARYLAELVKFRCMPYGAFFVLLKVRSGYFKPQSFAKQIECRAMTNFYFCQFEFNLTLQTASATTHRPHTHFMCLDCTAQVWQQICIVMANLHSKMLYCCPMISLLSTA